MRHFESITFKIPVSSTKGLNHNIELFLLISCCFENFFGKCTLWTIL